MLKAINNISSFDGQKDIRAWLFTIARNIFYNKKRKDKRLILEDFSATPTQDTGIHFNEALIHQEQAQQIHQYLHNMNEPYKEVFTLRVFGELSFKNIGELFGKSENWARVTFYRAKNEIKHYMEEHYE